MFNWGCALVKSSVQSGVHVEVRQSNNSDEDKTTELKQTSLAVDHHGMSPACLHVPSMQHCSGHFCCLHPHGCAFFPHGRIWRVVYGVRLQKGLQSAVVML